MKTLLILFLLSGCILLEAQYPNTVYFSIQPRDFGLGLRYDHEFKKIGFYTSLSRGNYKFSYSNGATDYIKDHVRVALGVIAYGMKFHEGSSFEYVNITGGLIYHSFGSRKLEFTDINPRLFKPLSFEVGTVFKYNRFAFAARTDILKWELCLDIGLSF